MSEQLIKASSAVLNPIDAPNGATARVAYTPMLSTDNIMLVWDGNDAMIGSQPGSASGTVDFAIPAGVVAESLGKTVEFFYEIRRDGKVWPSKSLQLTVLPLDGADLAASTPAVDESSNGALDLNAFEGDAHVSVAKWPLAAVGQRVWLTVRGPNGVPTLKLLQAHPIDSTQANEGIHRQPISRADLERLKPGDQMRIEFRVAFDGGSGEQSAVQFPVLALTINAGFTEIYERFHDYNDPDGIVHITYDHPLELKFMTIGRPNREENSVFVAHYYWEDNQWITAGSLVLWMGSSTTEIVLKETVSGYKFGIHCEEDAKVTHIAYDENHDIISESTASKGPKWVTYTSGGRRIQTIRLFKQGALGDAYLDNFTFYG
jgi:hypothetical protein